MSIEQLPTAEAAMFAQSLELGHATARSVLNHASDRLAALHQIETFIDTFERQVVRDQIIDVELAFHVPVNDARHIRASARAAKRTALPDATSHQLERACADLLPGRRHANDDALAPPLVTALERLPHRRYVTDALEAEI